MAAAGMESRREDRTLNGGKKIGHGEVVSDCSLEGKWWEGKGGDGR